MNRTKGKAALILTVALLASILSPHFGMSMKCSLVFVMTQSALFFPFMLTLSDPKLSKYSVFMSWTMENAFSGLSLMFLPQRE